MPRTRQPARLWLEPQRFYKDGRPRSAPVWQILHDGRKVSTGCGPGDRTGAERALGAFIAKQRADEPLVKRRGAAEVPIAEVLLHYMKVRGTLVAEPRLLATRVRSLLGFWGECSLDDIDSATCAAYVESRRPHIGGARRELEDLRTAVNLAKADKICRDEVKVVVGNKPKPRDHYLERGAIARLVWHAYRKRERQVIARGLRKGEIIETKKRPAKHLARFILFALYTGTRSRRVWSACFEKRDGHPWIDVENGIFHREAPGETASATKRAPPIRIPGRLLTHLRRWRDDGAVFLCEYRKGRCGDTKKGFARLVKDVLAEEGDEVVRHSLRHTAATWLLQADEDVHAVAGYLGMNTNTLIRTYAHHNPAFQASIGDAFTTGRAGRTKTRK